MDDNFIKMQNADLSGADQEFSSRQAIEIAVYMGAVVHWKMDSYTVVKGKAGYFVKHEKGSRMSLEAFMDYENFYMEKHRC